MTLLLCSFAAWNWWQDESTEAPSNSSQEQVALVLYKTESCPYCQKVERFLRQRGIQIPTKDTRLDPAAKQELMRLGGKTQVPCLLMDGRPLYESDLIIKWLDSHFKPSDQKPE